MYFHDKVKNIFSQIVMNNSPDKILSTYFDCLLKTLQIFKKYFYNLLQSYIFKILYCNFTAGSISESKKLSFYLSSTALKSLR